MSKEGLIFSIIIPVYNVEKYLSRCLESVINQTYRNLEIILVDDGSVDNSGKICDEYARKDKRIKVIHKENGGLSSARNSGLEIITGDYVSFVDSDDWILLDLYEKAEEIIKKEKCDLFCFEFQRCFGDIFETENLSNEIQIIDKKGIMEKFLGKKRVGAFFSVCTKIYKKENIESIKFRHKAYEDLIYNFEVFQKVQEAVIFSKASYCYFCRDGSITKRVLHEDDFDLIKNWIEIKKMNIEKKYNKLINFNLAYSNFALLAKAAVFGVSEKIEDFKVQKKQMLKRMRKDFFKIIFKRGLKLSRKLGYLAMFINFKLFSAIGKRVT